MQERRPYKIGLNVPKEDTTTAAIPIVPIPMMMKKPMKQVPVKNPKR